MSESAKPLLVALAGQQNAGKSTLFNALTGVRQHIANYPGVTVDKKSGAYADGDGKVELVDLPGTYSLTSFSLEERVVRRFLLDEHPDVVVNVLDATNLRRSLYMTFQLLELGVPVIVVLNMMDVAKRMKRDIDLAALEARLGVPVLASVGRSGKGVAELRRTIRRVASEWGDRRPMALHYGELETAVADVVRFLDENAPDASARWTALKLLEGDEVAEAEYPAEAVRARRLREAFEAETGYPAADHLVTVRDAAASELVGLCVVNRAGMGASITEKIDRLLLNRWLAPLFLLLSIWVIYELSIVQGYELTKVTWPFLAATRQFVAGMLAPTRGSCTTRKSVPWGCG